MDPLPPPAAFPGAHARRRGDGRAGLGSEARRAPRGAAGQGRGRDAEPSAAPGTGPRSATAAPLPAARLPGKPSRPPSRPPTGTAPRDSAKSARFAPPAPLRDTRHRGSGSRRPRGTGGDGPGRCARRGTRGS